MPSLRKSHDKNGSIDTAVCCAIYIRKSREEKDKPSHRLTVQREQLPAFATAQGWQISTYDDGHASAARGKAEALPERSRLEADIRAGRVDVILVIELSRLSRDDTLQDYLAWLTLCADYRVKLSTLNRTLNPSHHSDWMLLLMEGGFSTIEMKVMRDRMREGFQEAFRAGKYLGGALPPPYYLDKAAGKPVVDQVALARMQRLWSLAEANGCSTIARQLGMPLITVRRALQEERLLFCQSIRLDPDTGETIPCEWQPVMTAAQAQLIRDRREDRKRGYSRTRYGGLLSNLQGILVCGYCGRTVRSWSNTRKDKNGMSPSWYGCKAIESKGTCNPSRMITQADLDGPVVTNLINTIADPQTLQASWAANNNTENTASQLEAVTKEITSLQAKKQRLIKAISEGIIDFADAKKTRAEIETALQTAETGRSALLASIPVEINWHDLSISREEFNNLTTDYQREIILACIAEIKVYASYAIIAYRFPRELSGSTIARVHLPPPRPTRPQK